MSLFSQFRELMSARRNSAISDLTALARAEAEGKPLDSAALQRVVDAGIKSAEAERVAEIVRQAETLRQASSRVADLEAAAVASGKASAKVEAAARAALVKYHEHALTLQAAHNQAVYEYERATWAQRELALLKWENPEIFGDRSAVDAYTLQRVDGTAISVSDPDAPQLTVDAQTFAVETERRLTITAAAHLREREAHGQSMMAWIRDRLGARPVPSEWPAWRTILRDHRDLLTFSTAALRDAISSPRSSTRADIVAEIDRAAVEVARA